MSKIILNRKGYDDQYGVWTTYNEKMTDVNIATQMMIDAFTDQYDGNVLSEIATWYLLLEKYILTSLKNEFL